MHILYVTSEVYPLIKTGGLADVSAALPVALRDFDADVRLLLPAYPQALDVATNLKTVETFDDFLGFGGTRILSGNIPQTHVPIWLVDCPKLYQREGGPYQDAFSREWSDNAARFALLNHAGAWLTSRLWEPDVVHCHDWHAGLLPLLLRQQGLRRPATVFTIHNLAYQGLFPQTCLPSLRLPERTELDMLEFYGSLSFLKAGIAVADAITTVSPTYATEILTPEYGCGMEGLLQCRANTLTGIMNGADYALWEPSTDKHLGYTYSARQMGGKRQAKRALQEETGLRQEDVPLLAYVSRLDHQKMPDVVAAAVPALMEQGVQFVLMAEGDEKYEALFRALADRFPGRTHIRIGYTESMAHRIFAGADILLHPSRYEPCGLSPIYAMRYGTIPIVRQSGGMSDSVTDVSTKSLQDNRATGFHFQDPTAEAFLDCVRRALSYYDQPIQWRKIQATAMRQNFDWSQSAQAYLDLYRKISLTVESPIEIEASFDEKLTA